LFAKLGHPSVDASSIKLNLGFTRSTRPNTDTATYLTTGLTGHGFTPTAKSRKKVFKLSQFDLGLSFAGFGMLSKYVEDDCGAINDLYFHNVFEISALAWGKFSVSYHGVCSTCCNNGLKFLSFSLTEVTGSIRKVPALQ
jgi:hypothetical protein